MRITHARELIHRGGYKTVSELCFEVGHINQFYFSEKFKKKFGVSPKELITQRIKDELNKQTLNK